MNRQAEPARGISCKEAKPPNAAIPRRKPRSASQSGAALELWPESPRVSSRFFAIRKCELVRYPLPSCCCQRKDNVFKDNWTTTPGLTAAREEAKRATLARHARYTAIVSLSSHPRHPIELEHNNVIQTLRAPVRPTDADLTPRRAFGRSNRRELGAQLARSLPVRIDRLASQPDRIDCRRVNDD